MSLWELEIGFAIIQTFKLVKGLEDCPMENFFSFARYKRLANLPETGETKGHHFNFLNTKMLEA